MKRGVCFFSVFYFVFLFSLNQGIRPHYKESQSRLLLDESLCQTFSKQSAFMSINLDIYDGQNGSMVDDAIEETTGAITLANLNDTDNDAGILITEDGRKIRIKYRNSYSGNANIDLREADWTFSGNSCKQRQQNWLSDKD